MITKTLLISITVLMFYYRAIIVLLLVPLCLSTSSGVTPISVVSAAPPQWARLYKETETVENAPCSLIFP